MVVGQRELAARGVDCSELARAGELAIAIAIDPLASTAPPVAEDSASLPVFPPAAGVAPPPPPPEEPEPETPPPGSTVRLGASLGPLLALGSAPGLAGGTIDPPWLALAGTLAGIFIFGFVAATVCAAALLRRRDFSALRGH